MASEADMFAAQLNDAKTALTGRLRNKHDFTIEKGGNGNGWGGLKNPHFEPQVKGMGGQGSGWGGLKN